MLWVTNRIVSAGLPPDPAQLLVEPVARDLVERAERLVHQQDLRVAEQRAGDRHALALPPDSSCG